MLQQLLGILDAVQGGTGKAGYFLCDDEVKPPCFGVGYHPKEAIPLFCACSADALINIAWNIGPVRFGPDQLCVVLHLIFQTVKLFIFICGHSGVKGHPQGQIKDALAAAHLIADLEYIHADIPPLSSTQDTGIALENPSQNVPNPPPWNM